MNRRLVLALLAIASLVACGKQQEPASPVTPDPSAAAPAPIEQPAAPDVPAGDAILISGYVPTFRHKVRSTRDEGLGHYVVLEYMGVDRDGAIAQMSELMAREGFKVRGPGAREGAVQYAYVHADGRRMGGIYIDPSAKKLINPDARGIAMFSWTDPAAN